MPTAGPGAYPTWWASHARGDGERHPASGQSAAELNQRGMPSRSAARRFSRAPMRFIRERFGARLLEAALRKLIEARRPSADLVRTYPAIARRARWPDDNLRGPAITARFAKRLPKTHIFLFLGAARGPGPTYDGTLFARLVLCLGLFPSMPAVHPDFRVVAFE